MTETKPWIHEGDARAFQIQGGGDDPLSFHRRLPGYQPTPLHDLGELARELGVGALHVKDESGRLGLPAYKILGASWAIYRVLCRELELKFGRSPEPWDDLAELKVRFADLYPFHLTAATDGNHGRAVAHMARLLGVGASVYLPQGTARARIEAIETEGAETYVIDASYDEVVERAAGEQGPRTYLIQDTTLPGYDEVPRRVVEGYSTIFRETEQQLCGLGAGGPDLLPVQIGVGALAAAAIDFYRHPDRRIRPHLLGVEPTRAACALAALHAGRPVSLPGRQNSIMAGLNCGTLGAMAWPKLRDGMDASIAIEDERSREAVRTLARCGIESGESGAAGLAGLIDLLRSPGLEAVREKLELGPDTRVLVLSGEGATDPVSYKAIVG